MLKIPKILRKLEFSEYASELSELSLTVWVNPPRQRLIDLAESAEDEQFNLEWLAEMWSQGEDNYTPEEVGQFFEDCSNTDPGLWAFAVQGTVEAITQHRDIQLKN